MPFTKGHKIGIGNKHAVKHGMSLTPIWRVFDRMKERCENQKKDSYHNYGGRGIKVVWSSFENFYRDMNTSYTEHVKKHGKNNTQIDRIDNNGNYCKENCRWATIKEQSLNRRTNVYFTFNGKTLTISQWGEKMGMSRQAIRYRLNNMSLEKALTIKN